MPRNAASSCGSAIDTRNDADRGGDAGQRQRLDEQLRDDAAAAGAERAAHGDLALARRRARVDQDRDVHAHDDEQQHQRESGSARIARKLSGLAHVGVRVDVRQHARAQVLVRRR